MNHILKSVLVTLLATGCLTVFLYTNSLAVKEFPSGHNKLIVFLFVWIGVLLFLLSYSIFQSRKIIRMLGGRYDYDTVDTNARFKLLADNLISRSGDKYLRRAIWRLLKSELMISRLKANSQGLLDMMNEKPKIFKMEIEDLKRIRSS